MRARLGFSVAVHLEPEILLLDEVLGVGDAGFQRKCREKLEELTDRAEALVLVSHSERLINRMATRVLWLDGDVSGATARPWRSWRSTSSGATNASTSTSARSEEAQQRLMRSAPRRLR